MTYNQTYVKMILKVGQRVLGKSNLFSNREDIPKYFEMEYKGVDMDDDGYHKQRHHFVGVGIAYENTQLWTPDIGESFKDGYLKLKKDFKPLKIPIGRYKFK